MESHLKDLHIKRDKDYYDISQTYKFSKNIKNKALFIVRCTRLDTLFTQFHLWHADIRSCCVKLDQLEDYTNDAKVALAFDDKYYQILACKTSLASLSGAPVDKVDAHDITRNFQKSIYQPLTVPSLIGPHFMTLIYH